MKNPTLILIIALLLWMCGSSYWYVCRIKGFCQPTANSSISNKNIKNETLVVKITEDETNNKTEITINEPKLKFENKVVYFEFGKDNLKSDDELKNYFNELKLFLNQNKTNKIDLIGHTDDVGDEKENELLGLKRAECVKKMLIEVGIEDNQIQTISKGENDPTNSNVTKEGRDLERRVEIIIN